jgi:hypothetical protein
MSDPVAPLAQTNRSTPSGSPINNSPPLATAINRPLLALMLLSLVALTLAYQVPIAVDLSQPGVVLGGFYDLEGRTSSRPYRWTDGHARVWLAGIGRQPYHLVLTLSSARPNDVDLPNLSVLAGDAALGTFKAPRPVQDFPFELGAGAQSLSGDLDIHIDSETFAPPGDLRTLGVIVYALRLEPSPSPHLVFPAPLPLIWGTLIVSLLFLALRCWPLATRLAWPIALLALALICFGIAAARLQTVSLLPWAILLTTTLYAFSLSSSRRIAHPLRP